MDKIIKTFRFTSVQNDLKYNQLSHVSKGIYDNVVKLHFAEGILIPDLIESCIKNYNIPFRILENNGKYFIETETFRIPESGYLNASIQYYSKSVSPLNITNSDTPVFNKTIKEKQKVAILIIATNKYVKFLLPLIKSAQKYLLKDNEKKYFIFTNNTNDTSFYELGKIAQYELLYIDHYPFPIPTLFRFYYFQKYFKEIEYYDQIIYIDADALFSDYVNEEVMQARCAVQHCGYFNERGTYETNPESKFYVPKNKGLNYFGGGFWSFSKSEFLRFISWATENLTIDLQNHIIPIWHDESILNRWLIDNPPNNILSPSYHYPEPPNERYIEKWKKHGRNFAPKIIMLNKNHDEIRNDEIPTINIESNKLVAVILFHSNIHNLYKEEWINDCLGSLQNQTYKNFKVFEFCYGNKQEKIWQFLSPQIRHEYYHSPAPNHVFAENNAIQIAYAAGFDYFFIVNLDDIYDITRIEKQLSLLNNGYDLVSSDFVRFYENGNTQEFKMSNLNFGEEAEKNHNIISHPVVAFNRNFWEKCRYFDVNGIPEEDFSAWKSAYSKGLRMKIVPDILLRQRVHANNISRKI